VERWETAFYSPTAPARQGGVADQPNQKIAIQFADYVIADCRSGPGDPDRQWARISDSLHWHLADRGIRPCLHQARHHAPQR
jgi:hypothetical protein